MEGNSEKDLMNERMKKEEWNETQRKEVMGGEGKEPEKNVLSASEIVSIEV